MSIETLLPDPGGLVKPFKFSSMPHEYQIVSLRECPVPDSLQPCETPDKAVDYWGGISPRIHTSTQSVNVWLCCY